MRSSPALIALFALGCQGSEITVAEVQNSPPAVVINSPNVEAVFFNNEVIKFIGTVSDPNGLDDIQSVSWVSSIDGPMGDAAVFEPNAEGLSSFETILSEGSHAITFSATDSEGETAQDTLSVSVGLADPSPEVNIVDPANLDTFYAGEQIDFLAVVDDPQYGPSELDAVWTATDQDSGTTESILAEAVDAQGETGGSWTPTAQGNYKLTLEVWNPGNYTGLDEILVIVGDAGDEDLDLDGQTPNQGDCDDGDNKVYDGAPELPDGIDNDCDGDIDEGTDLVDDDGDGFCESTTDPCTDGALQGDCDDSAYDVNPDADEVCNDNIDNNCDSSQDDEDSVDCVEYFYDFDDDGYGTTDTQPSRCLCDEDQEWRAIKDGDCNDSDDTIYPNANESPNGIDDNCDGTKDEGTDLYDNDGDGYCANNTDCTDPSVQPGDCNDGDGDINPGEVEICGNNVDDNCNNTQNEQNATGCNTYHQDSDGDGYGHKTLSQCWCAPQGDYDVTSPNTDCLDTNSEVNPGHNTPENNAYWTGSAYSYDYNCDGNITEEYTSSSLYTCSLCGLGGYDCCSGNGWVGTEPACGETRNWGQGCYWIPVVGPCDPNTETPYTQRCY